MNVGLSCNCIESLPFWIKPSGYGFDEDSSVKLMNKLIDVINDFWKPDIISRSDILSQAREALMEIYYECSQEDWDGYRAAAIIPAAFEEALKVIYQLPSYLSMPEIVPEPNGGIGFEWRTGTNKVLVINVTGQRVINYAAIFGSSILHGSEYFEESLPSPIISGFQRLRP